MTQTAPNAPPPHADTAPLGSLGTVQTTLLKSPQWTEQLERLLADTGMKLDRFAAIIVSACSRNNKILGCTRASFIQAVQAAAELGLELGGIGGEAYLIPYENRKKVGDQWVSVLEAQFIAGYKGYLRVAQENPNYRKVFAEAIFPDDLFEEPEHGPNGVSWRHKMSRLAEPQWREVDAQRTEWKGGGRNTVPYKARVPLIRGAYAVAQRSDTRADDDLALVPLWRLEEIRTRSKAGQDGPWITDYVEMAKKTAIRALWKQIQKTERMKKLEALDQELVLTTPGGQEVVVPAAATPAPAKVSPLADRIAQKARAAQGKAETPAAPTAAPSSPAVAPEPTPADEPGDESGTYDDSYPLFGDR